MLAEMMVLTSSSGQTLARPSFTGGVKCPEVMRS